MAKRQTLLDLIDGMEKPVRDAFLQSIGRITAQAQMRALEDAISRGDVAAVLQMLEMDRSYFVPLDQAFRNAHAEAGEWAMQELRRQGRRQGVQVQGYFDARNPRIEEYLASQSARLVTGPDGLIEDARTSIRAIMAADNAVGTSPRTTALNIVGRINRATGERTGGVIGLLPDDAQMSVEMERGLIAGDKEQMDRYIRSVTGSRSHRDAVGVRRVELARAKGEKIPASEARAIATRWRSQRLRLRGETIARTELLEASHNAQHEALRQLVDSGKARSDAVTQEWDASEDSATRLSHRALDGEKVRGPDGVFTTINGARLRYPGDRSLGAPASETVNCRCILRVRVSFVDGLRDRLTDDELATVREAMG